MSLAATITLSSLELTRFFFAMVLLLFTAHSLGFLFYEAKLPRVIGEIFGGLILGQTFLGILLLVLRAGLHSLPIRRRVDLCNLLRWPSSSDVHLWL